MDGSGRSNVYAEQKLFQIKIRIAQESAFLPGNIFNANEQKRLQAL